MNPTPAHTAVSTPLQRAVDSGLLSIAVPIHQGGSGGTLADLASGFAELLTQDTECAMALRQQRLGIELLMHSRNAGLRDLVLPDLLQGARAATVALESLPLAARNLGSAWLLNGRIERVTNLAWEGFWLLARAQLDDLEPAWVLLRSEEDGLNLVGPHTDHTAATALCLRNVYFRMDEWLGGEDLSLHIKAALDALTPPPMPTHVEVQRDLGEVCTTSAAAAGTDGLCFR